MSILVAIFKLNISIKNTFSVWITFFKPSTDNSGKQQSTAELQKRK